MGAPGGRGRGREEQVVAASLLSPQKIWRVSLAGMIRWLALLSCCLHRPTLLSNQSLRRISARPDYRCSLFSPQESVLVFLSPCYYMEW